MSEKLSVKEMKEKIQQMTSQADSFYQIALQDERKGVQAALKSWEKQQEKRRALEKHFEEMQTFERKAKAAGYQWIAGIDEVGRGPLAGPVVAAAVILPEDFRLFEVNDSKQLSAQKREELYAAIQEQAVAIGIGVISEKIIDEVNIYEATKLAMLEAIKQLKIAPDYLLIDAMKLAIDIPQESLIKGDARSVSIACASIIAKVTRDNMMAEYHEQYPDYDFIHNAGYGTKKHLAGLKEKGVCPIHRKTFAPIKNLL